MDADLQKDASFDLGPPRNARKWQQAKDYAASVGRAGDFAYLLQVYSMLDLLPAYKSLPRLRLDLGKARGGPSMVPPRDVRDACRRGLELREEHGGDGLTASAVRWAGKLAAGDAVTPEKAAKMHAYFARHAVDRKPDWGFGKPTPGYCAWLLWGGDAGRAWAAKLRRQMDKANMGRKKANGRRQGLWAWAKEEAKRRGKPESYAVGIARTVMGKSLPIDLASWAEPGSRLSQLGELPPSARRMLDGSGWVPPPIPMVADLDEAVRDLPIGETRRRLLADKMRSILTSNLDRTRSRGALVAVIREHGRDLHPALAGRLAHRVLHLAGKKTEKGKTMRLDLRKAGGEGSRGGKIIGHTSSGKPIYQRGNAGRIRGWTAADHHDAAEEHSHAAVALSPKVHAPANKRAENRHFSDMMHHYNQRDIHESARDRLIGKSHKAHVISEIRKSGGEGSRGGKIIGHTRGGKPIYASSGGQSFTGQEHAEAAAAHRNVANMALGNVKSWKHEAEPGSERSAKIAQYSRMAQHHAGMANLHEGKSAANERVQTPGEKEFAARSPASRQDFTGAKHPWGGKSIRKKLKMNKSGGEGSRGGKIVGHSRSGKPIYASSGHLRGAARDSARKRAKPENLHPVGEHQGKTIYRDNESGLHHVSSEVFKTRGQAERFLDKVYDSDGSNERMATPKETAQADRASGSDRRMMTPAESGRLAVTPVHAKHPWEGKSLRRRTSMRKSVPQPFDHDNDTISAAERKSPFGYGRLDDGSGRFIEADAGSLDQLGRMIADFNGASVREKAVDTLTAPLPPESPEIDSSGNAPAQVPGGEVTATSGSAGTMSKAAPMASMVESGVQLSHQARATDASYQTIGLWQCLESPDIEGDDRYAYVGRC